MLLTQTQPSVEGVESIRSRHAAMLHDQEISGRVILPIARANESGQTSNSR